MLEAPPPLARHNAAAGRSEKPSVISVRPTPVLPPICQKLLHASEHCAHETMHGNLQVFGASAEVYVLHGVGMAVRCSKSIHD